MMSHTNNGLGGEEPLIRDLVGLFKDSIMKTGEDINMLAGKFDSDLKTNCKSKLEKHMKTLVELETRLAMEKDAAAQAMSHIGCAFSGWSDWQPNTNDEQSSEQQEMDNDEDDTERPSSDRPSNPEYDRILGDEQLDLFQEALNKMKSHKTRRKQDPRVKALKALLSEKQGNVENEPEEQEEDEDMIMTTQDSIPIDPITKMKITDPVKNVKCGHIYDKNGIKEFLKTPNPRCPYMGCVNRVQIKSDDLVADPELKQKIEYLMALEEADESESDGE